MLALMAVVKTAVPVALPVVQEALDMTHTAATVAVAAVAAA
jgi:hypothetical protein